MAIMRRKNLSPGGRRKHRAKVDAKVRKDHIDDSPEYRVVNEHQSRHWQVRVDEIDAFGPVTVRNGEGEVVRVIEIDALRRPWQEKVGNTWNNVIFPKRNSDKV